MANKVRGKSAKRLLSPYLRGQGKSKGKGVAKGGPKGGFSLPVPGKKK